MRQEAAIGAGEGRGVARPLAWLAGEFLAERSRWPLWLPVLLGLGIGGYFLLPMEPPVWLGAALLPPFLGLAILAGQGSALRLLGIALVAVALGFAAAQLRTATIGTPLLEKRIGPAAVQGRVIEIEARAGDWRLTLDRPVLARLSPEQTPRRIRFTARAAPDDLRLGDIVRVRAVLRPPPGPAAPGAFDFQRHAFFEGIGGVGYAVGRVERVAGEASVRADFWIAMDELRRLVTGRIRAAVPGEAGAVAAALVTGDRAAISEETLEAMRGSGLSHLLSISGLHMTLVAGTVFFCVRFLLALTPLALSRPIKKWAALAAILAAFFYLLLSGATVPTQRSFVMTGLVFAAVLIDRVAISFRLIAWAAAIVMLIMPEALLGPSFQMSFAAVLMLIAFYEANRDRLASQRRAGPLRWIWLYALGLAITSVLATIGTTPYSAYHFNQVAVYGTAANMVAVPLTGIWVMPLGVLALLLMPLGLEGWALTPMGWGIEAIIETGRVVAAWPGAVLAVPAMPDLALAALSLGGLWLLLWRRPWRHAAVPAIILAMASPWLVERPALLVDDEGKLAAIRAGPARDAPLLFTSGVAARFTGDVWLRRETQERRRLLPRSGMGVDEGIACDRLGCIVRRDGLTLALARDAAALPEDCRIADLMVSLVPVRRRCPSARAVIDRFDLWRDGAHAVYIDLGGGPQGIRLDSVRARRGDRPWTPVRPASRRR
ncbi:hypothetical protein AUP43_05040 [Oceanibaculum pacificum]|uniref:Competence protein ComEC n=2 Tax=Oceanibaculum pacificum TaxID=580166 RepID=A0A154WF66_9PROT|nr:hypothetical protein AUP43_05040 [Oceanibaculum pacificum]